MMRTRKFIAIATGFLALLFGGVYIYYRSMLPEQPPLAGRLIEATFVYKDTPRRYMAYLPASQQPDSVLFMLHGSGSDPERSRSGMTYEFDVIADRENVLVVYPQGYENHWNDCRTALSYSASLQEIDDVGFLVALKNSLIDAYDSDPAQAFVVGMSNGGHMVNRLAYEAPDAFRGYAVIAANLPVEANFKCQPVEAPVNMLILAGTEDPISPFGGGQVSIFGCDNEGDVRSAEASASYWAEIAGYRDPGAVETYPDIDTEDESRVSVRLWQQKGMKSVRLMTVEGGGHSVPHPVTAFPPFFGPTNHDINAPQEIWRFFSGLDKQP